MLKNVRSHLVTLMVAGHETTAATIGFTMYFLAFSRDQKEKIYVQNLILEQKELIWRLLQEDAVVYVCGDASSMAPAVREAFSRVISHFTSEKEAKVYMDTMEESKRYLEDVWG